ncbi:TetR/AcrR family transcriptional regulator [Gordonia sp. NPDC057258]|uniref:TetR/AcrR family transcriptional regulator n=1 Tax=Gordonia TaxID=2053 RepID=UPI0015DFF166|nr:TetR/AcrR family transcriptional regulator [Gordonia terrae]
MSRILAAAGELLDGGADTLSISELATALGVTRQTVYRYFSSAEEVLRATAEHATADLAEEIRASVGGIEDLAEAVVEAVAVTIERVHENPRFRVLFTEELQGKVIVAVTSDAAIASGRQIIESFDADLSAWDEGSLGELSEHMLRTLQSFLLDSGGPARLGGDLRRYLRRWVGAAIGAHRPLYRRSLD